MAKKKKAAKAAAADVKLTWTQRVEAALRKAGGKGRLVEIAKEVPLPDGWDPALHLGSDVIVKGKRSGSSLEGTVWAILNKQTNADRFRKIAAGEYALIEKKAAAAPAPAKKAKATKKQKDGQHAKA